LVVTWQNLEQDYRALYKNHKRGNLATDDNLTQFERIPQSNANLIFAAYRASCNDNATRCDRERFAAAKNKKT
jgi:hypothetical protein